MSGNHPNNSIIENGQNTEKCLEKTCCHSNSSEKPSAKTDVKNSRGDNSDNNNLYIFSMS